MNRTLFALGVVSSTFNLLMVDSAIKGTALLVLAAIAAVILRRDSAATRYLVWLLAIVAILVVPVLSAMLPRWRVLPEWAGLSPEVVVVDPSPPSIARPKETALSLPQIVDPLPNEQPSATAYPPAALMPDPPPVHVKPDIAAEAAAGSWNWKNALPIAWAIGFSALVLRLLAARWMLWNSARQGSIVWSSEQPTKATHDPLVAAVEAVCAQLGIFRPVTLLIHPDKTIPVVWGILRSRLRLPAAALNWSDEQVRSVLLHELAHVKRRDTTGQLLVQFACTLYWFNPLVWFAAWRLSVERERACDDLVLAGGVRPSAYAGHLLEIVTELSPARGTHSCGLAIFRKSSLEGRLGAVLSQNLNRRGVSAAVAAIALALAAMIAVPIAMLRAADDKPVRPVPQKSQNPTVGAKLQPGMEDQLKWGNPVNGLRAALVIRPAADGPKAGEGQELYLAVQNVSNAPIRVTDTTKATRLRYLQLRRKGETLFGIVINDPTMADLMLKPSEVAYLLMFGSEVKDNDGHTEGSAFVVGALRDTHQTLVAELKIEQAPAGAWTGKLVTGETTGRVAAGRPQPRDKNAQALYSVWQHHTRENENIPGGLVGRLRDKVKEFIRLNIADRSGNGFAKRMVPLVARLDAARDWTPAEVAAVMDEIAAVTPIPLITTLDEATERTFQNGEPLPPALANAPWGDAQPSGLRMAWLLEPRAAEHRVGTPLKSRILFHNAGKDTVVFRTRTWHQSAGHKARDAKGADIKVDSVGWTTIGQLSSYRLEPGEFVEVMAAGIGVGAEGSAEDWQDTRVGAWVEANVGDDVTVTPGPVALFDRNEEQTENSEPHWWLEFIKTHLAQDLPMPAADDERTHLVYRAGMELFGTPLGEKEIAAFVADREPTALDALAQRLAHRPGLTACAGEVTSGPTRFRVLPADPDAANKPRTASNPGRYALGENIRLVVSRRPVGERIVNEASIEFFSADPAKPAPGEAHQIKLPDGYDTWAAAWERGSTVLWVLQRRNVRSYDFRNPAHVQETTLEAPANLGRVPKPILDALRATVNVLDEPKPAATAPPAASPG